MPTIQPGKHLITGFLGNAYVQFGGLCMLCVYYYLLHQSIFLDDAFIYFRVVRNMIATGIPVFNAGDSHFITTSPLWVFLLTMGKILLPTLEITVIAKLLWASLLAMSALFAFKAFYPCIGRWAVFLPLPFFLSSFILTSTGNEIALLYMALFGMLWATLSYRFLGIGLFLGLGYLCRGEFIFMVLPLLIHLWFAWRKKELSTQQVIHGLVKGAGLALLLAVVWHGYYLFTFHKVFPDTFQAKIIQGQSGYWPLFSHHIYPNLVRLLGGKSYLLGLALIGAFWQRYLFGLMFSYLLLHSLAYSLLQIPHYHWYHYDYNIFCLILILFGIIFLLGKAGSAIRKNIFPSLSSKTWSIAWKSFSVLSILLAALSFFAPDFSLLFTGEPSLMFQNQVSDSRFNSYSLISNRLRPELQASDVLLAQEIGIIGYLLPDTEIRDINGLASPGISLKTMNKWPFFIHRYHPRYLMFFRDDQPQQKTFDEEATRHIYNQAFSIKANATQLGATIYQSSDEKDMGLLGLIKLKARLSPDVRFISQEGEAALFCHSPFESRVDIPAGSSGFSVQLGFAPGLLNKREEATLSSNGFTFSILHDQNEKADTLYSRTFRPFGGDKLTQVTRIEVNLDAEMNSIRILIDPIEGESSFDWAMLMAPKFISAKDFESSTKGEFP